MQAWNALLLFRHLQQVEDGGTMTCAHTHTHAPEKYAYVYTCTYTPKKVVAANSSSGPIGSEEKGLSTGGGSGVNRVAFLGELELRRPCCKLLQAYPSFMLACCCRGLSTEVRSCTDAA